MLLIDENLSYRLMAKLTSNFPGTVAVAKENSLGEDVSDRKVWEYAKSNNLAILTKDKDSDIRCNSFPCSRVGMRIECPDIRFRNSIIAQLKGIVSLKTQFGRGRIKKKGDEIFSLFLSRKW